MLHYLTPTRILNAALRTAIGIAVITSISALWVSRARAQVLIYQEGFNNDGEAATPKRYTTIGRDVYELSRQPELQLPAGSEQAGPLYWAPNF